MGIKEVILEICCSSDHAQAGGLSRTILNDVVISGMAATTDGGSECPAPMETVSFNYARIRWEYSVQKEDDEGGSTVERGWDLASNQDFSTFVA